MFTGIITAIGRIETVTPLGDATAGVRLIIYAETGTGTKFNDIKCGDSIAIQGACITVTATDVAADIAAGIRFMVEVSRTTLNHTIGLDAPGEVNLEKALHIGGPLDGHFVLGHIDGIGTVTHFAPVGESYELRVLAPHSIGSMLVYKGSIAVNGVSLTINSVKDRADGCECSINLIPYTMQTTTLKHLKTNEQVNLEVDLIARYIERYMQRNLSIS